MAQEELITPQPAADTASSERSASFRNFLQNLKENVQSERGSIQLPPVHNPFRLVQHERRVRQHETWRQQQITLKRDEQTMNAIMNGEQLPEPFPFSSHVEQSSSVDHPTEALRTRELLAKRERTKKLEEERLAKIEDLPGQERLLYSIGEKRHGEVARRLRGANIGEWNQQPVTIPSEKFNGSAEAVLRTELVWAASSLKDKTTTFRIFDAQEQSTDTVSDERHPAA